MASETNKPIFHKMDLKKTCVQILYQQNGATQASSLVIAAIYFFAFNDVVPKNQLNIWCI